MESCFDEDWECRPSLEAYDMTRAYKPRLYTSISHC